MGTLGRVLVCIAILGAARQVDAATKLCFPNPTSAPIVDVPVNPRFVVERTRLRRFAATDTRGERRALPYTVEDIDEYRVSVTVQAGPGTVLFSDDTIDWRCSGTRYRVVTSPAVGARARLESAALERDADGAHYVQLHWNDDERDSSWTRFEWAFDRHDLEHGLHGARDARYGGAWFPLDARWRTMFVRLVRYHVDGTSSTWTGWVHVDHGAVRIGTGEPPHEPAPRAACAVTAPRNVPVDPTFHQRRFDPGRFAALSASGAHLPIEVTPTDDRTDVAVRAPEGAVFQLHALPRLPGCSTERWLRATADRSHDEAPIVVGGENGGCAVHVDLADAHTWGEIEVATPRAIFAEEIAGGAQVTNIADYGDVPFAVRITPIWNGVRGRPWDGWIEVEPRCAGIRFGAVTPVRATALAPVAAPAPGAGPAPSIDDEPTGANALLAALGLLLLGLAQRRLSSEAR